MIALSCLLSFVLIVLAALHLMWALGRWFPLGDERALAQTVLGARGVETMPGAVACALVVVALLFGSAWAWLPLHPVTVAGLAGLAAVFAARGVAACVAAWRRLVPEEPFATLDRRIFGPLCLGIGAGFLNLTHGAVT